MISRGSTWKHMRYEFKSEHTFLLGFLEPSKMVWSMQKITLVVMTTKALTKPSPLPRFGMTDFKD